MVGERSSDAPRGDEIVGVLVAREPRRGSADIGADPLIRSARADLARLSLELRVALRDAEAAERTGRCEADEAADVAYLAAREHLRTGLESRLGDRRTQVAAEVEEARAAAGRFVGAARAEAAALVAAVQRELPEEAEQPGRVRHPEAPPSLASTAPVHALSPPPAGAARRRSPGTVLRLRMSSSIRARARRPELLHADVLLPLIAGLLVLVALLVGLG